MYFMAITIRAEAIGAAIIVTKMVRVSRGFILSYPQIKKWTTQTARRK
jgi:hypothetical protein